MPSSLRDQMKAARDLHCGTVRLAATDDEWRCHVLLVPHNGPERLNERSVTHRERQVGDINCKSSMRCANSISDHAIFPALCTTENCRHNIDLGLRTFNFFCILFANIFQSEFCEQYIFYVTICFKTFLYTREIDYSINRVSNVENAGMTLQVSARPPEMAIDTSPPVETHSYAH